MSSFVLKIIACITMLIDHSGYAIMEKFSFFNFIGRIAFPIFAFQISEGYAHTKNLKKYFLKLTIFALISQIPFMLFTSQISTQIYSLNIFFTLLLGLLCITIYEKLPNKFLNILFVFFIVTLGQVINVDYGAFGILSVFVFHLFKNKKTIMNLIFIYMVACKYAISIFTYGFNISYIYLALCTISPLIFINLYNKKQGKKSKYFLYFFYPVHLLVLFLVMRFI